MDLFDMAMFLLPGGSPAGLDPAPTYFRFFSRRETLPFRLELRQRSAIIKSVSPRFR